MDASTTKPSYAEIACKSLQVERGVTLLKQRNAHTYDDETLNNAWKTLQNCLSVGGPEYTKCKQIVLFATITLTYDEVTFGRSTGTTGIVVDIMDPWMDKQAAVATVVWNSDGLSNGITVGEHRISSGQ